MRKTKSGFTIVELLIVIVVIGILAAITIVAYNGIQTRSRDSARLNDAASIKKVLSLYKAENDNYPTSVPNPGSSTWEISTNPGFLSSLSDYTKTIFKAPGQQSSTNAYWYHNFTSDSGCPGKGTFAILWIRGMEAQASGVIKNRCVGSAYFNTPLDKSWYVEYLY